MDKMAGDKKIESSIDTFTPKNNESLFLPLKKINVICLPLKPKKRGGVVRLSRQAHVSLKKDWGWELRKLLRALRDLKSDGSIPSLATIYNNNIGQVGFGAKSLLTPDPHPLEIITQGGLDKKFSTSIENYTSRGSKSGGEKSEDRLISYTCHRNNRRCLT